jgi:hypothetical protein
MVEPKHIHKTTAQMENSGRCMTTNRLTPYLLSLPERVVRSATALAGGLFREIGEVTIPGTIRRTQLYQHLVEATLRFLIEHVGQVEGVYPGEEKISEDFLVRRTAGNGIELIGVLTFRASPVWVLAALADITGAGRQLIREISDALKEEGLLDRKTEFSNIDQLLDGLERSAGRLASNVNAPPLDVATLRQEWESMKSDLSRIPVKSLPSVDGIRAVWADLKEESRRQNRTVFEVSSLMAMAAVADVPEKVRWLSASTRSAAHKTGLLVAAVLLDHYRTTLKEIHETGYLQYAVRQFRPYLFAAVSQFSPKHRSLTERLLMRKKSVK